MYQVLYTPHGRPYLFGEVDGGGVVREMGDGVGDRLEKNKTRFPYT